MQNKSKSAEGAEVLASRQHMAGLDYVCALRDGRIPLSPMAQTIGWRIEHVAAGQTSVVLPLRAHLFNRATLHGGAIASLMDAALSQAVNSTLPAGMRCQTMDLRVSYIAGVPAEIGEVVAEAEVLSKRTRTALAQARIVDRAGTLYAHATATFALQSIKPKQDTKPRGPQDDGNPDSTQESTV